MGMRYDAEAGDFTAGSEDKLMQRAIAPSAEAAQIQDEWNGFSVVEDFS